MRIRFLLISTLFLVSFFIGSVFCQTVGYNYDINGNITSRKVIVLKSAAMATNDSIISPDAFDDDLIDVRIFPNPTKGELIVEVFDFKEKEEFFINVFDLNGRIIIKNKKGYANNKIDLSQFSNGVYILKITRNRKESSWRIIKID